MLPAFNEQQTTYNLKSLDWTCGLAFGAACASRIIPVFDRFRLETRWGDIEPMLRAMDTIWGSTENAVLPMSSIIERLLAECEDQVPDSEEFHSLFTSGAQDSVFAVCSLLDFCTDMQPERLALAARYPTDCIDLYVQEVENMRASDADLEANILRHPLMQQELKRQKRDLHLLIQMGRGAIRELISRRGAEDGLQLGTK